MATAAIDVTRLRFASRPLFVATIFAGSFLLFLTQPMIARMALPRLGGAPAVWNSAMLVYQALLLAGYAYAHALGRFAPRIQAAAHVALLAGAALWLPIGLAIGSPSPQANPALWVPWLLTISIGPLFFAVSAQAPLMQRWFGLISPSANPYPLYAASNLGSFGGLIAYPLLVEPNLPLAAQSAIWTAGYALLFLLVLACAVSLPRRATRPATEAAAGRPSALRWARWIALAAVPSGLMLAVTTHLTTDIVAMPLIWVIPLGLYLLSFTIAFSNGRAADIIQRAFPIVLILAAGMASVGGRIYPPLSAGMDILLLFVTSVTLHRELYRRRPAPAHLTGFYLAMSIGGALGGVFCALAAPLIFNWVYEYPLLILAAGLLRPHVPNSLPLRSIAVAFVICSAATLLSLTSGRMLFPGLDLGARLAALILIAVLARIVVGNLVLFGFCLLALMLAINGWRTLRVSLVDDARTRSYFGVYTVTETAESRLLTHGTTLHGIQRRAPGEETRPSGYYPPQSGIGLVMAAAPALFGDRARIGVVGLGAGTLACYARPGQDWRFYEIDPAVVGIARNPAHFTFLSRCLPDVPIVIGDARLTLAAERGAPLDLLVVDAFSSDAVPQHLLTLEAMEVYRRRLAPHGLLVVHISNRFIDLQPVLAAAGDRGWATALRDYNPGRAEVKAGASRSLWVAMARDPATLSRLVARGGGWKPLRRRPGFAAWTDDYGSILPVLKARPN
jgi:hypothetical protein